MIWTQFVFIRSVLRSWRSRILLLFSITSTRSTPAEHINFFRKFDDLFFKIGYLRWIVHISPRFSKNRVWYIFGASDIIKFVFKIRNNNNFISLGRNVINDWVLVDNIATIWFSKCWNQWVFNKLSETFLAANTRISVSKWDGFWSPNSISLRSLCNRNSSDYKKRSINRVFRALCMLFSVKFNTKPLTWLKTSLSIDNYMIKLCRVRRNSWGRKDKSFDMFKTQFGIIAPERKGFKNTWHRKIYVRRGIANNFFIRHSEVKQNIFLSKSLKWA